MLQSQHIIRCAVLAAVALAVTAQATAQRTTRRHLSPRVSAAAEGLVADTIFSPADSLVLLSGYDKPLRATKESIFITNQSQSAISAINITIDYLDKYGRMLHQRTVTLPVDIPAGETRKADFASWDSQRTFYFHQSPPARTHTRCYPYSVKCRLNYIVLAPCSDT